VRKSLRHGHGGGALIWHDEVLSPGILRIVALGKAACTMAQAAAETLSPTAFPGPGIIVVNDENAVEVPRFRVLPSGHPIPDHRGETAARDIERYLAGAQRDDGLLLLLSGGGSALLPSPADGVTLEEKAQVTRSILDSGAAIGELNAVRKHLSRLKGGGFAARAFPAAIEALILSDVIGDDLSTIAGEGLTEGELFGLFGLQSPRGDIGKQKKTPKSLEYLIYNQGLQESSLSYFSSITDTTYQYQKKSF
jgi:glycerate-2-kinase